MTFARAKALGAKYGALVMRRQFSFGRTMADWERDARDLDEPVRSLIRESTRENAPQALLDDDPASYDAIAESPNQETLWDAFSEGVDSTAAPVFDARRKVQSPSARPAPMTAHDRTIVRRMGKALLDAYFGGDGDDLSEAVILSSGYASVEMYPDEPTYAEVVRDGKTTRVPMKAGPARLATKHKAGRKTSTRKKVPAKKHGNPSRRPKPRNRSRR